MTTTSLRQSMIEQAVQLIRTHEDSPHAAMNIVLDIRDTYDTDLAALALALVCDRAGDGGLRLSRTAILEAWIETSHFEEDDDPEDGGSLSPSGHIG